MKKKITCLVSVVFAMCSAWAQLPEQFDARDLGWITEVKDQSQLGTCWTFATTSLFETSYIRAGLGTKDNTDFSEWQMANYAHPQSLNEYTTPYYSDDNSSDWGGSSLNIGYYAQAQFSSVFVTEANAPYPLQAISEQENLSSLIPSQRARTLGSAIVSRYGNAEANMGLSEASAFSATDVSFVKNKVQEFGSARIGMPWSSDAISQNLAEQTIYNNTTGASAGLHATTIVGWDDSVDVGDGKTGAFIVKNSWASEWGNDGYYYLAYDSYVGDANLSWLEVSDASHLTSAYSTLPSLDGTDENYAPFINFDSISAATKIDLDHTSSHDDTLLSLGMLGAEGDTYRLSLYDGDEVDSIDGLDVMSLLYQEDQTLGTSGFQMFDLAETVDVSEVDDLWLVYESIGLGSVALYEYDENALSEDLSFTLSEDGTWEGATASNTLAGVNFYMIPEPSTILLFSIIGGGLLVYRRNLCV